jgi:UDP-glucose 4-epimerase
MKRLVSLVTGCGGFVGSHVAGELLAAGHDVVGLDDLSGGFADNVPEKVTFVEGSIQDEQLVKNLFEEYKFDYVFHLAAYAAEGLSPFIRSFNYRNNLLGSVNLINAAVNAGSVKCFLFTSSMAVYGSNQVPMREDMIPSPEDPYGVAKFAVEMDLKQAHEMFGLDYIIIRPHNVYGPRQHIGDRYRNVIGIFMNQIMLGRPTTIFGDGLQTRAFSYISDVAPVIAQAINRPEAYNEIFNVGADQPYTILELAHAVSKAMGVVPNIRHLETRKEVTHAFTSHDKAKAVFGDLLKNVPLHEGLQKMADWCWQVGGREPSRFGEFEINKGLYSFWKEDKQVEKTAVLSRSFDSVAA